MQLKPDPLGGQTVRFAMAVFFWLVIAPLVLLITVSVLTRPISMVAISVWGDYPGVPAAMKAFINGLALLAVVGSGAAIWYLWKRFKSAIQELEESAKH